MCGYHLVCNFAAFSAHAITSMSARADMDSETRGEISSLYCELSHSSSSKLRISIQVYGGTVYYRASRSPSLLLP